MKEFKITQEDLNFVYSFISKVSVSGKAVKDVAKCMNILETIPMIEEEKAPRPNPKIDKIKK